MPNVANPIGGLSPLKQALLAIEEMQGRLAAFERSQREPIAIIGMGCRFPQAPDPSAFWRLLHEGVDAVGEVPPSRWRIRDYYHPDADQPGRMSTKWGGFLEQVDQFDPEFFGISPREALLMDPQQRLLLEVAWEALENAAQGPADLVNGKTGVFLGITGDEYSQRIFCHGDPALFNAYFASGIARSVAGGRISYTLGIEGPNLSIDTACSSSLVAVHNACLYLRSKQCRMALAGGVNVILSPEIGIAFSKAHMMAADGRCKAFDSRADGFVRAEGCGVIVLKRLSDALADRDRILAVIRGSAINQDGRSSGLTVPNVNAQEAVIREALAAAGLHPADIGYIEAHGTGTALGDPIEARALARVFGPGRSPANHLVVGSVKTNLGHLEAAAGIAGLIKTVLALQYEEIPPHLHFHETNPHIDWGELQVAIPSQGCGWRQESGSRRAGISAFGFSGTNAHIILENAAAPAEEAMEFDCPVHLLPLSARTETALRKLIDRYAETLSRHDALPGDIGFSAAAGRTHFERRIAVTGNSAADLRSRLLDAASSLPATARDGVRPVFLFPGQGSQYPGMGKELYDTHPAFRRSLNRCAELLEGELDEPLLEVLWGRATHLLDQTAYTQPALFAIEYALAELWKSWGIQPAAVLGHSIGEYAAACVAGVYTLADGLTLIAARGRLMQSVSGCGAMAAAAVSEERVRRVLNGLSNRVSVAALNAPESVVISGYADAVEIVEARLRAQDVRVQRLAVSHAFHSQQMEQMADQFARIAGGVAFRAPEVSWISSVTGRLMGRNEAAEPQYWRRQVREPVRFRSGLETLDGLEHLVFLEIGPGATLSALGPQTVSGRDRLWLPSLKKGRGEWQQLLDSLALLYVRGADVNWAGFHGPYRRKRVELPTYPFERQRYWFEKEPSEKVPPPELTPAPEERLFKVHWEASTCAQETTPIAGKWLVIGDREGVAAELAGTLASAGGDVSMVEASADIRLAAAAQPWNGVVFLSALNAPSSAELTLESLERSQRNLLSGALDLIQGIAAGSVERPPRLWLVTRGAQAVGTGHQPASVAQASLWGMAQAVGEEYPELRCCCVDLDPHAPGNCAVSLLGELRAGDTEQQVAYRDLQRMVARIIPYDRVNASAEFASSISPDASYLVTGGFGALGLRLTRWLIEHGAKNLVLVSRSGPGPASNEVMRWAATQGVRIVSYRADISDWSETANLFSEVASTLPPLRGVIHAAAVLDDGTLAEQDWERFAPVLAPKVMGSWNLHLLTRTVPLDFFVLFSSLAAVMGAPGQANYAAANAFQDALAHHRRNCGLAATSIAWGAWIEGLAARPGLEERRGAMGFGTMSPDEALRWLEVILSTAPTHILAGAFDWDRFAARFAQRAIPARFAKLVNAPVAQSSEWLRHLNSAPVSSRLGMLQEYLRTLAIRVLGFNEDRMLDNAQPLNELGLDSLMAVEFRNVLAAALQRNLPATLLFSYPAIDDVTQFVRNLLWGDAPQDVPDPTRKTPRDTEHLLDRLEQLSDEEIDRMLDARSGVPT